MAIKLGLIEGENLTNCFWNETNANPYNQEQINKIKDNVGDVKVPITSIPSPFARMHLFDAAFKVVNRIVDTEKKEAAFLGHTLYQRLISECLDVFELMYSFDILKLKNQITVAHWNMSELEVFETHPSEGLRNFADTLKLFINNYNNNKGRFGDADIKKPFNSFTLFFFNHEPFAGTSPYTGFFTAGDMPSFKVKNLEGRVFFDPRNVLPLHKRSIAFQRYINLIFETEPKFKKAFLNLHQYIINARKYSSDRSYLTALANDAKKREDVKSYTSLKIDRNPVYLLPKTQLLYKEEQPEDLLATIQASDFVIETSKNIERKPLALMEGLRNANWNYLGGQLPPDIEISTEQPEYNSRTLPGSAGVVYPFITRNDVLSENLIDVGYELNDQHYWSIGIKDNNYLLPIKQDYFKFFTIKDLKQNLKIETIGDDGAILVRLRIPLKADRGRGSIEFERTYMRVNPRNIISDDNGSIIDGQIHLGIYPFFKINGDQFNKYNDLYKIALYHFPDVTVNPYFIKEQNEVSSIKTVSIKEQLERTRASEGLGVVSKYIELSKGLNEEERDLSFDIIGIDLHREDGSSAYGILIPQMQVIENLSNAASYISVDLGTSNTYVGMALNKNKPYTLTNYNKTNSRVQLVWTKSIQREEDFRGSSQYDLNSYSGGAFMSLQYSEFMPSIIGENEAGSIDVFGFPLPTMLNQDNDVDALNELNVHSLLNVNIPFQFGKLEMRPGYDNPHSNLKWGIAEQESSEYRNRLRAFIEQIALMGRNTLLQEGRDPSSIRLIWYKPLSMGGSTVGKMKQLWEESYEKLYSKKKNDYTHLYSITESWAPYFSQQKHFGSGETYVNVDIGGGTTDVLLFKSNKVILTSSFRFAGNDLFDEGIESNSSNNKDNGFVQKFAPMMDEYFNRTEDFTRSEIMNQILENDELRSEDLISFLFTIKEFRERLDLETDMRILFLLHNCAIFYHTAQLIKLSGNNLPSYIGLSGNGAKLLSVTNRGKDLNKARGVCSLVQSIFRAVLDLNERPKIELHILDNPKMATAQGGIKALAEGRIQKGSTDDIDNFWILTGDDKTLFKETDFKTKREFKYVDMLNTNINNTIEQVAQNYQQFIHFFFDEWWYECDFPKYFGINKGFDPEALKTYLADDSRIRSVIRGAIDIKMEVEQETFLTETLFFSPLEAFIYNLSKKLSTPAGAAQFKR